MSRNRLDQETSPYLLQHRDNPVHWQAWGPEALAQAQRENKPILLSIGYAACHWCHVMAHESFEGQETAELMNELFVSIKVDREERPDLDAIYQAALALMGEHGGWPLNMFLTATGEPFWGGTYFPPTSRYGRPGFNDVLRRVAEAYRNDPEAVQRNAKALLEGLNKLSEAPAGGAPLTLEITDKIADSVLRQVDPVNGGIGDAPKFPQSPVLELLWRAYKRTGKDNFRQAVTLTLDKMCQGGIYDHLGGGFARYAVDSQWLVPHFEKMLYDNAQLIDVLTLAWQDTRSPLYAARIEETAEWALREMLAEGGGFASSFDADSEGEEGKFYLWSEAEIDRLLGPEAAAFKQAYDVTPGGNWEDKTILNRSRRPTLGDEAGEAKLAAARAILWKEREKRVRPGRDDKVLADWNGLMIAALAGAGVVFERPHWLDAAARAFAFVRDKMTENGRLHHSWCAGQLRHPAALDDYANMGRAAQVLYQATGEPAYLEQAESWAAVVDRHYWDDSGGGYFFTADDTENLITRTKSAADQAVPSGNGTIAGVLARLHYLTGKDAYRRRAEAIISAFSGELTRNAFPLATLLNANELLQRPLQIVIVGERSEPDCRALLRAVYDVPLPDRVLQVVAPDGAPGHASLPEGHPAQGKGRVDGRAAAYVCVAATCSLPITEPDGLRTALRPQ